MAKAFGIAGLLFVCCGLAWAQAMPSGVDWQKLRSEQPADLHLKLTLPKDHYFQGELIKATLVYSCDSPTPAYRQAVGGEGPGGIFCAEDVAGRPVENRLKLIESIIWMEGGLSATHLLGSFTITLPANQDVRFDRPGTYQLYAEGSVWSLTTRSTPWVVSDKVSIVITPLTPDEEKQTLADALKKISAGDAQDPQVVEGMQELNALQTPAARDAELPFLGDPNLAWQAGQGFTGALDSAPEATRIKAAVDSGKLVLSQEGITTYAMLKALSLAKVPFPANGSPKEIRDYDQRYSRALATGRQEIVAAMVAACGQGGPHQMEVLWTAFNEVAFHGDLGAPDSDGVAVRAALAQHQLQSSDKQTDDLIRNWPWRGSADFLPLIRRKATDYDPNPAALIIFAGLSPREARPLVLHAFQQDYCPFFTRDTPSPDLYCAVTPMPMPEIDSLLRKKFTETCSGTWPILPAIACFGSKDLLPDVLDAYQRYGKHWDSGVRMSLFLYWLRADPKGGPLAVEHEIASHEDLMLAEQLRTSWSDQALPVARWLLQQSDPQRVLNGITLLQLHGDASEIAPVIVALKHLPNNKDWAPALSATAQTLLASTRWHYTPEQKKELEVLVASATSP